jgi:hypothetical protein
MGKYLMEKNEIKKIESGFTPQEGKEVFLVKNMSRIFCPNQSETNGIIEIEETRICNMKPLKK